MLALFIFMFIFSTMSEHYLKTIMSLKKRIDIDVQNTWDLEHIFPSVEAFELSLHDLSKQVPTLQKYKNQLGDQSVLLSCLEYIFRLEQKLEECYIYASYMSVVDMSDSEAQMRETQVMNLYTLFSQEKSFLVPELTQQSEVFLQSCIENKDFYEYTLFLKQILRSQSHILSEKEEVLLARAIPIFSTQTDTFSQLNDVDIEFNEVIDTNGKTFPLTHGTFSSLLESYDPILRKNAYEEVYRQYARVAHTFASTLHGQVKQHHFLADVRKYDSSLEAALFDNAIDTSIYKGLIDTVNKNLHVLHRAMEVRKKLLGVSSLHMWDLRVPLFVDSVFHCTYEEAVDMALQALSIFGDEYISVLKHGLLEGRWVDRYENKGKRSGAFSGGSYTTYPYILLNFTGSLNDLYTLIHEAGHSMHSYYARKHQPYGLSNYTIFTAEIASTVNERLLTEYLLQKYSGLTRNNILTYEIDMLRGTFFRQTMFAEFEHSIHQSVEEGKALTKDFLNEYYASLNKKYYGPIVENDIWIQYEWARVPHFYYNYYVYQYATGVACAYNFVDQMLHKGNSAIHQYLSFLQQGGNNFPLDQLQEVGMSLKNENIYTSLIDRFTYINDTLIS